MSGTVKVRVAVAVDTDGDWVAQGWPPYSQDGRKATDPEMESIGQVGEECAVYWLTAELEVPELAKAVEVAADVDEDEDLDAFRCAIAGRSER